MPSKDNYFTLIFLSGLVHCIYKNSSIYLNFRESNILRMNWLTLQYLSDLLWVAIDSSWCEISETKETNNRTLKTFGLKYKQFLHDTNNSGHLTFTKALLCESKFGF